MFWLVLAGFLAVLVLQTFLLALVAAGNETLTEFCEGFADRDHASRFLHDTVQSQEEEVHGLRAQLAATKRTATAPLVGERVVVNLTDGSSIRGVLADDYPAAVVLEHADYLAGQQPEAFAGRAVIPRAHLIWTQSLGAD